VSREDRQVAADSRSAGLSGAVSPGSGLRHDRTPRQSSEVEDARTFTANASASAIGETAGDVVDQRPVSGRDALHSARFALTKFRPTTLPTTLLSRPALHGRLEAGASQRLTVVVGSAGAGKSVLLSSWAATRDGGVTSWLSCDEADADPVRFWAGFIEAPRAVAPGFGVDAGELLAMDGVMSADVTASIVNAAARLPAGSVIVVDDFHAAAAAAARTMTDLVERWPARTAQLVLAGRVDPPLRLHRLRLSGELCELRDRDLYLSLAESGTLLGNFGVQVAAGDLELLHRQSEGWVAAMQMAALTLRTAKDPAQIARALDVRSHAIAEYFIGEVLQQQPPEVAAFMLDTSVLDELTAEACATVTGRQDAAALLHSIEAANLFIVALDDDRTSYRYHHLVRDVLRAELRAIDRGRELTLRLRVAEWLESAGDTRGATRHFLAAGQAGRALGLLQERVAADLLHDPAVPAALDLSRVDPSLLTGVPERLLALAADLLLWGDWVRGGEYLDLLERTQPAIPPDSRLACRLAVMRSLRCALSGEATEAVHHALAARSIEERTLLGDEWGFGVPLLLLRAYTWLEDFEAVDREVAAAQAMPSVTESARLVDVRGAQALAWFEAGRLAEAADAAQAADADARRLGFEQHPFAVDYLRVLAGAALERRDLNTAEHLTERVLSISERFRPVFEFLALLDRAAIWAARGQIFDALANVETARLILAGTTSVLLARADELEALLRLSLGDLRSAAGLAGGLPAARRGLVLARVALAANDHYAALGHLDVRSLGDLTPRGCAGPPGTPGCRCDRARRSRCRWHRCRRGPDSTPRGLPQHGRHDRTPGDALSGRAFGPGATGAVPGAAHRCSPEGPRHPAGRYTIRRASRSAADSCRAAGSETPADQQLRADGGHPLHLPQYGEDPSAVDLPEAGGVLAVRSD
jgi:LuxR family transcriptional regulator, maltose regulon positive regulatory protein